MKILVIKLELLLAEQEQILSFPLPFIPLFLFQILSVKCLLSHPAMHRLGQKKKGYAMVIGKQQQVVTCIPGFSDLNCFSEEFEHFLFFFLIVISPSFPP